MREVSFQIGEANEAECYVTILNGDGGGVAANINRWQEQMGQPPLDEAAFNALPTLRVLGTDAPLVEIRGRLTGVHSDAPTDYLLVGAISLQNNQCVFIKLIGPESVVRPELAHFKAFCASLRR